MSNGYQAFSLCFLVMGIRLEGTCGGIISFRSGCRLPVMRKLIHCRPNKSVVVNRLLTCTWRYPPSEQQVDGETLSMLSSSGTLEQYQACGLRTTKDQLQLRKLLGPQNIPPHPQSSSSSATTTVGKLSLKEMMKAVSPRSTL